MTTDNSRTAATSDRGAWVEVLGGEYGGKVNPRTLTWECSCGANGTGGAIDLFRHRQRTHHNGTSEARRS